MRFQFAPSCPRRTRTVYGVPIRVSAQSFAESSSCQRDRRERPGCSRLHEEVPTVDEISRYGAARINSAAGAVLINEANRHVANAMSEAPKGEREPAVEAPLGK